VATRIFFGQSIDTTNTQAMSRTGHYARDVISSLQLICTNFPFIYEGGSQVTPSTCKMSVEYPAGVCTPVTFSSAPNVSVAYNAYVLSDAAIVSIPNGALFWVRIYETNSATLYETSNHIDTVNMGDATALGTSVPDQTVNCTIVVDGGSSQTISPGGVIALTAVKSVSILGDSLVFGAFDTYDNSSGDIGVIERTVGASLPYMSVSADGLAAQTVTAGPGPWTALFNTYSSSTIIELAINDTVGNGRTLLQVEGYLTTIYSYFTTAVFQTTITMATNSTDNWATSGNQSAQSGNSTSIALNDALRAATFGPSGGYLEVANGWSVAQDSPVWKNPGAGFGACSPPVGGLYWTHDGVHGTPCGYLQMQSVGTINLSKLR